MFIYCSKNNSVLASWKDYLKRALHHFGQKTASRGLVLNGAQLLKCVIFSTFQKLLFTLEQIFDNIIATFKCDEEMSK